jgi:hypothetical protein
MKRYLTISLALVFFPAVRSLHAANKPRARSAEERTVVWTNEDLEELRGLGHISVVGPVPGEDAVAAAASGSASYLRTQDLEWYAEQAAKLRAELESRQAQLQRYRQALEDGRDLKTMTGGINLDEGDVGITPGASIEILERRVEEAHADFDALEDLARRNDIPPGILRGQ